MSDSDATYDRDTKSSHLYNCGLDGKCEKTYHGKYRSLEKCQANCTAVENKDLIYQILAYDPSSAEDLPPSGQIRVVKEMLGVKVSARTADKIIKLFARNDWGTMRKEKLLEGYFERQYTPLQLFTRDLISTTDMNPNLIGDYTDLEQKVLVFLQDYSKQLSYYIGAQEEGEELNDDDLDEINSDLADNLGRMVLKEEAVGNTYSDYVFRDIEELVARAMLDDIVEDELSRQE